MSHNIEELSRDRNQWPRCPNCGEQNILIGGFLACCCSCKFTGRPQDIASTRLLDHARAKMAGRSMGHRGIIAMIQKGLDENKNLMTQERASQMAQRMIHEPLLYRAARHFLDHGTFLPIGILQDHPEDDIYYSMTMTTPDDVKRFLIQSRDRDVVSVIWKDNEPADFFQMIREPLMKPALQTLIERDGKGQGGKLFINTHIYNAPSHVQSMVMESDDDPSIEPGYSPFNNATINPIIWQPIWWPILTNDPGRVQPRWMAALEVRDEINVTLSVCEDFDGAPLVRVAIRKPLDTDAPDIRSYQVGTAEEGIVLLRAKYQELLKSAERSGADNVLFAEELEWEIDAEPHLIQHQIRTAKLWEKYQLIRIKR